MSIINKNDPDFPKNEYITVNGKKYKPDTLIDLRSEVEKTNIKNCTCVFSILDRDNLLLRKYVGVKYYEKLTNDNIKEKINGYLPEHVFCFYETDFPIEEFKEEQDFKHFS